MFETAEVREKRVAEKREIARPHPGVNYDARIDRFTAEIYVDGVRKWLGSYSEIEQAIEAYQQAKQERPVRSDTFNAIYRAFRERHGGERGTPPEGAVLEYDGQQYKFHGVTFRKIKGGSPYAFYRWEGACRTCGEFFLTQTAAAVSMCKSITRNCPEHTTRGRKRAKSPTSERGVDAVLPGRDIAEATPTPYSGMKGAIASQIEVLAMVYETLAPSELAEKIFPALSSYPYMPNVEALEQYLRKWPIDDEACPFVIYDEEVAFF